MKWTPRVLLSGLCGAQVLPVAGCSTFNPPEVAVDSVTVTEQTEEAIALSFDFLMSNSNAEPVELVEFDYELHVNGRRVYTGRRDAQTTVPAGGSWTLDIPAVISYSDVGWTAASHPEHVQYEISGSLLYISPGALAEVLMDAGVYRPTTGFGERGELSLGSPVAP